MRVTYYIFGLVGLALAACAAYVSVTGWAQVFAGSAATVTVIMAVIEAGKVTAASLAYRLREVAPRSLIILLAATTVVTMVLTSMGIYGFFSKAYQTAAGEVAQKEAEIAALERKRENFQETINRLESQQEQLGERFEQTQDRVSQLSEQYSERGWATDKEALQEAEKTLQEQRGRQSQMGQRILQLEDSVAVVNKELTELKTTSTDAEAKLSTVQFAADITGYPRSTIANVFILAIVFVFDPAAIAIILATNVAAEKTGKEGFFEETITEEPDSEELYEQAREGYEKEEELKRQEKVADRVSEEFGEALARGIEEEQEPLDADGRVKRMQEFAAIGDPNQSLAENVKHIDVPSPTNENAEELESDKQELEENSNPEPASFSLISWLQRTSDPVVSTHKNWSRDVGFPENPTFARSEPDDYIEQELQELNNPDSIRREVSRIIGEEEEGETAESESDNRYIVKVNGGVDHDPSRE